MCLTHCISSQGSVVRLQWDPDHHPSGQKLTRKAIQLGLKGSIQLGNQEGILKIRDITDVMITFFLLLIQDYI